MTNNYVGPGWYWVEGAEDPVYLRFYPVYRGPDMKLVQIITNIPRPAQRPVVDWSVMPAWAKYIAQDEGGEWCWFVAKPDADNSVWLSEGGRTGTIPLFYRPKYTGDWRNSLVERPE